MKNLFKIEAKKDKKQLSIEFDKIAKKLLTEFLLKTPQEDYLIREIEFYYFTEKHSDYYCHKNERQKSNSKLYFHRFKNPERYLNLKQKGIDITIGNESNISGGILIRTLQNISTLEIITGIGKITNMIIKEIGGAEIISKIYENNFDIFHKESILQFIETENNNLRVYKKQRIGLNLKEVDSDGFFHTAKYNYFTYPEIDELK